MPGPTTESPAPTAPIVAVLYQPIYLSANVVGAIHEATLENGVVRDRTVIEHTSATLADSAVGHALVAVPRPGAQSWTNGPLPGTIDLDTGTLRTYSLGRGTTTCILRSPDPTKLLVCYGDGPQSFLILGPLPSDQRQVAAGNAFTVKPIGWTTAGIFFSAQQGASVMDPKTSAVMGINSDVIVTAVSPSGSYFGGTKNAFAGDARWCSDSIVLMRKDWTTITAGARQGVQNTIVSQEKKDFRIVAIGDDGNVVYTESDCPPNIDLPLAPTTLYYFFGGHSTPQPGLQVIAQGTYMAATLSHGVLLNSSLAVVEQNKHGTKNEIDLVQLCTVDGCTPTVSAIVVGDPSADNYGFSVLPQ